MIVMDDAAAREVMSAMVARLHDPTPLYKQVGEYGTTAIQTRLLETKESPDLIGWKELSMSRIRQRAKRGTLWKGLLRDDDTLLNSMGFDLALGGVQIGTSIPYAEFLQDGTEHMVARPFVGWSDADMLELDRLTALYVSGE